MHLNSGIYCFSLFRSWNKTLFAEPEGCAKLYGDFFEMEKIPLETSHKAANLVSWSLCEFMSPEFRFDIL